MDKIRLILASALAPLIAATIVTIILAWLMNPSVFLVEKGSELTGFAVSSRDWTGILNAHKEIASIGLLFGMMMGWPAMLISALPLHSVLVRMRQHSAQSYAAVDAVAGTVLMMIVFGISVSLSSDGSSPLVSNWPMWLSGPLTGAIVGFCFWQIRRPDLSEGITNRTSRVVHGVW